VSAAASLWMLARPAMPEPATPEPMAAGRSMSAAAGRRV
jgi:hypothetical protein